LTKIFWASLNRIQSISLKWKLLIPFLFFAFTGTTVLTYIGLTSQQKLIKEEEKKGLLRYYHQFNEELEDKKKQAKSLAVVIAANPRVQEYLAERNRQALIDLLLHTYVQLKMDYDIEQFHFHLPVAVSFLRLHYLERYGEEMRAYRKTIVDAMNTGRSTSGLEHGVTGFGIRGVAPIYRYDKIVGSVEIGHGFDKPFLKALHDRWGIDLALYEIKEKTATKLRARAGKAFKNYSLDPHLSEKAVKGPTILIAPEDYPERSILLGPVKDYSGKVVALVEINLNRSWIQSKLLRTRTLMVMVGLVGIAISFLLTYLVTFFFIRPIRRIVSEAQDIAEEKRESHLEPGPEDEIGSLTQALNVMLDALRERRLEIEKYARTLEKRVQERTADLVASEEKYRTLVENVPLIVYRVLPDGTTEFINSYMTESLGYSIEEAVSDKTFWREKIYGVSLNAGQGPWESYFENREERRTERLVRDKNGHLLNFIDHAIPAMDADGKVKWIDGIMMDISELKSLQERALRGEEIRILGEISAHMAHEIRNPLIAAGGFARRLRDSLPARDPNRKLAQIIVEEVARLENFLKILISSIRPFDLHLTQVDVNHLVKSWLIKMDELLKSRGIGIAENLQPDVHKIQADEERLNQAFENLLKHAIVSTPEGEKLFLSTSEMGDRVVVILRHKVHRLSEDDLDKFFFPHIEDEAAWMILDLPFSKMIIHRHGGKVDLTREGENVLQMRIELPMRFGAEGVG
jgi:PAS domain S-box-containing protein